MHRLFHPAHRILAVAALLLLFNAFLVSGKTIDVHLHDTYYVIGLNHAFGALAVALALFWALYKWAGRWFLSPRLTRLHIALTVLTAFIVVPLLISFQYLPGGGSADTLEGVHRQFQWQRVVSVVLLLLLAGQLIFPVNLLGGIAKRIGKREG